MKNFIANSRDYAFRCKFCKGTEFIAMPDGSIGCVDDDCRAMYAYGIKGKQKGWICINETEVKLSRQEFEEDKIDLDSVDIEDEYNE